MLQKFEHEGLPVEIINLDGRSLFNASQIGDGLYISPSGVRDALFEMEDGVDYALVTNAMIRNCSNVALNDIRKLANRGENFLTESGVYELMIQSRRPEAKSFRRWITREVLPSIRETGSYGTRQLPSSYPEALRELAASVEARLEIEKKLAIAAPKAEMYDITINTLGTISMLDMTKIIHHPTLGRTNLFKFLRKEGILMRNNLPMRRYEKHFDVVTMYIQHSEYEESKKVTRVYPSGISFIIGRIIKKLGGWDRLPSKDELDSRFNALAYQEEE